MASLWGRKTMRMGPVRFTLSKSGITESIGTKRARISLKTTGKVRRSVNLGYGFRWSK